MKWEYKWEDNCSLSKINALGDERWELVSVYKYSEGVIVFYFKRPKTLEVKV